MSQIPTGGILILTSDIVFEPNKTSTHVWAIPQLIKESVGTSIGSISGLTRGPGVIGASVAVFMHIDIQSFANKDGF